MWQMDLKSFVVVQFICTLEQIYNYHNQADKYSRILRFNCIYIYSDKMVNSWLSMQLSWMSVALILIAIMSFICHNSDIDGSSCDYDNILRNDLIVILIVIYFYSCIYDNINMEGIKRR